MRFGVYAELRGGSIELLADSRGDLLAAMRRWLASPANLARMPELSVQAWRRVILS